MDCISMICKLAQYEMVSNAHARQLTLSLLTVRSAVLDFQLFPYLCTRSHGFHTQRCEIDNLIRLRHLP